MTFPPAAAPAAAPAVPVVPPLPPAPVSVYWTFADPINDGSSARFNQQVPLMMQMPTHAIHHVLIQTAGGTVGDGIWLYNFLKSFPRNLIVYNTGTIASIGTIAYLGAPQRKASTHATFMLHRTTYTPVPTNAANLAVTTKILSIEDQRTESILRERAHLTDDQWRDLDSHDLWLTAQEAVAAGIADEIAEFTPLKGGTLFII
jgi:ATP-dependent protease ClpP protease subunit